MKLLIEILGILGIVASIVGFQCKKHNHIMISRTANELLFGVQYLLLGAYTGMAMNGVGCIRNLIFRHTVKHNKNTTLWVVIFNIFFIAFGIITWTGPKSMLIIIAKVLSTVAYSLKNTTYLRGIILVTASFWLIYNVCVGSVAGAINEGLTLVSIIVGTIRMDILPKLKKATA